MSWMRHVLFVALMGLIVSPAAQADEMSTCALHERDAPRPRGYGTVLAIQDPAMARANIVFRQLQRGGSIDQRYLDDVRAVVRQDNGIIDRFDVLKGMTVRVGDRVKLQGSYRSTAFACSYIPQMVVPNDAPSA
jgi:hypothetical protein